MGYDLHITRKEHWADENSQLDISVHEWEMVVANDPELEIDNTARIFTTDGERSLYKWTGIPLGNEECALFDFDGGTIDVKNPDNETIKKMCKIAVLLIARVQGDDGEIYQIIDECVVGAYF